MHRAIFASLLLIIVLSQKNYQQRSIFYGRANNICCTGHKDLFNLIINLDDTNQMRRVVNGNAFCMPWSLFCADAVTAMNMSELLEGDGDIQTWITFDQEITNQKTFGIISHTSLKVTIRNPTKIMEKQYTCTILGDGTEHHWGIDF